MNKIIYFNRINEELRIRFKEYFKYFLNKLNINKNSHILIVGLGNDNYTADSVGPKTLKHIKANAFFKSIGANINTPSISLLEPGTLGETGIITEKIIKKISEEIKPDLIILIDAFLSKNIKKLNKTIEINDIGISTGMGIKKINSNINYSTLETPIIVIGVPTAIEVKYNKDIPYILSSKNVDKYIEEISEFLGNSINETINDL